MKKRDYIKFDIQNLEIKIENIIEIKKYHQKLIDKHLEILYNKDETMKKYTAKIHLLNKML
jgi:hypothetical protein